MLSIGEAVTQLCKQPFEAPCWLARLTDVGRQMALVTAVGDRANRALSSLDAFDWPSRLRHRLAY
jgi:hypothetical protein